jgi:2-phospho-L-lactate guanylyltransferase
MSLWTLVPVKPLRRGKSRLAGVLTEEERTFLNYAMLGNTLSALSGVQEIDHVLVVSRDSAALALARDYDFKTLQEDDEGSDLNMALTRATIVAQFYGASSILILPADLPLLKPIAIQDILNKGKKSPVMVISSDRHKDGTNALFVSPVGLIKYCYGKDSFHQHINQAELHHIPVEIIELPALELDLDLPEDLELLQQLDISYQYSLTHQ